MLRRSLERDHYSPAAALVKAVDYAGKEHPVIP
jgi:hypothetical protein